MKKILVIINSSILICLILVLASCKKSNTDIPATNSSQYYMRFKGNGTQKEFTATTAYYFTTTCSLNGGTNDSTGNAFTINIYAAAPILANSTYTETEAVPAPNSYTPKAYFAYGINSPSFYNYGSWIAQASEHSVYACTVKILELDATHVKGTFSGKVRERNGSAFINITDGEFNVKRIF
jgi:hypothetical protein